MRVSLAGCIMFSLSFHAAILYLIFSVPLDTAQRRASGGLVVSLIDEGPATPDILGQGAASLSMDGSKASGAAMSLLLVKEKASGAKEKDFNKSGDDKPVMISAHTDEETLPVQETSAEPEVTSGVKSVTLISESRFRHGPDSEYSAVNVDIQSLQVSAYGSEPNMEAEGIATEALAAYESKWRDFSLNMPASSSEGGGVERAVERVIEHVAAKAAPVDMPPGGPSGDVIIEPLVESARSGLMVSDVVNDYVNPAEMEAGNPGHGGDLNASGQGEIDRSVPPVSAVGIDPQSDEVSIKSPLLDTEAARSPEEDSEPAQADESIQGFAHNLMPGYEDGYQIEEGEGSDISSSHSEDKKESVADPDPGIAEDVHVDRTDGDASYEDRSPSRLDETPPGVGSMSGRLDGLKDFAALELQRLTDEREAEVRQAEEDPLGSMPGIRAPDIESNGADKQTLALGELKNMADAEMKLMFQETGASISPKEDGPPVRKMVIKRSVHFELTYPRTWDDETPGSKDGFSHSKTVVRADTSSLPEAASAWAESNPESRGEYGPPPPPAERHRGDGYAGKTEAIIAAGLKAKEEAGRLGPVLEQIKPALPRAAAGVAGWDDFGINLPVAEKTNVEAVNIEANAASSEVSGNEGTRHGIDGGADDEGAGGKQVHKETPAVNSPVAASKKGEMRDGGIGLDILLGFDIVIEAELHGEGDRMSFRFFRRPYPGLERRGLVTRRKEVDTEDIYNERNINDGASQKKVFWVERAGKSVYAFIMATPEGQVCTVDLRVTLRGIGQRVKEYKGLRVSRDEPVVIKFVMPDAIFWDDEEYFTGSFENSNSVTKFSSKTGFAWKEKKEY